MNLVLAVERGTQTSLCHMVCSHTRSQDTASHMRAGVSLCAEVLQYAGLSNFSEVRWWNVGRTKLQGEDLNYFGIEGLRIAGGQGIIIIAVCQVDSCSSLN